jgi:hypothetical protein
MATRYWEARRMNADAATQPRPLAASTPPGDDLTALVYQPRAPMTATMLSFVVVSFYFEPFLVSSLFPTSSS